MNEQCVCYKPEFTNKINNAFLCYSTTDTLTIPDGTNVGTSFRITTLKINGCYSTIRFNFSSNLVTDISAATLDFQIFKQCPDQLSPIPVSPVWRYTRLLLGGDAMTFSFKACDKDYDGCCTYYVAVTVVGTATIGLISINNANLSALAFIDGCSSDNQYCGNDVCQSGCCGHCFNPFTRVLSKCSSPSTVSVAGETASGVTFTLATLQLNTEKFNQPCIELEFSTNIIFPTSLLTAFMQVYKQCNCQLVPIPIGPTWLLDHLLPETIYDTFTFHVHDCIDKTEICCTYYVLLTVQFTTAGAATMFRNSALHATIADSIC
ncbi:MAG: DUF4489 domain-containing protein [Hungatella sp.]|jgi:hypothetical protein|nr:DUF4489 domain-containing protein [Hungatella sp.]